MIYQRNCAVCDVSFEWDSAKKGRKQRFCSQHCARRRQLTKDGPICVVPDCTRIAVTKKQLCMACYHRQRRTGSLAWTRPMGQPSVTEKGYVTLWLPKHPLAKRKGGRVMEHRLVLYEKLGPGAHPCFWCGVVLEWKDIRVDHLNESKGDNYPDNLVASCNTCNRARGQFLPFLAALSDASFARFVETITAHRKASCGNRRVG
jgi:hypothetical protein